MRPLAASSSSSPPRPGRRGCGEQAAAPAPPPATSCCCAPAPSAPSCSAPAPPARCPPASPPPAGARCSPPRRRARPPPSRASTCASGRTLRSLRLPGRWALPATVIGGAPDAATRRRARRSSSRARARASRGSPCSTPRCAARRAGHPPRRASPSTPSPPTRGGCSSSSSAPAATTSCATTTSSAASSSPARSSTSASPTRRWQGQPVARAVPAAAPWVYTLYRKASGPFVHALNTDGFALCIDLPRGRALRRRRGARVGPRPVPRRVDALRRQPRARPRRRDRGARRGRGPAHRPHPARRDRRAPRLAVSPDGAHACTCRRRAAWRRSTPATLAVRRTLLRGHRVSAVVASGRRLYAQDGAVVALDAASGRCSRRTPTSAPPAALAAVLPAR